RDDRALDGSALTPRGILRAPEQEVPTLSERMSSERVPLTTSGRRQIEDEAGRLQTRLAELRDLLEDAHADRTADDDERAAALALLDEYARLEARLSELRAILESAV